MRPVRWQPGADLGPLRRQLGLTSDRPVVVVVGGAGGMAAGDLAAARRHLAQVVLPVVRELDAVVVDGGTDVGVMKLVGEVAADQRWGGPLVGVAVEALVALDPQVGDGVAVERHHTHLVLVPGTRWGDECRALSTVAGAIAGNQPSVTILVNGGQIARRDVQESRAVGRPVVVATGTGRLADELAATEPTLHQLVLDGEVADRRAALRRVLDRGGPGPHLVAEPRR